MVGLLRFSAVFGRFVLKHLIWCILARSYIVALMAWIEKLHGSMPDYGERRREPAIPESKHYAASYIPRKDQSGSIYQAEAGVPRS